MPGITAKEGCKRREKFDVLPTVSFVQASRYLDRDRINIKNKLENQHNRRKRQNKSEDKVMVELLVMVTPPLLYHWSCQQMAASRSNNTKNNLECKSTSYIDVHDGREDKSIIQQHASEQHQPLKEKNDNDDMLEILMGYDILTNLLNGHSNLWIIPTLRTRRHNVTSASYK
eukprot:scaffold7456_cov126-Skeletonema_dohrnii-CCMP3373.AAC.9